MTALAVIATLSPFAIGDDVVLLVTPLCTGKQPALSWGFKGVGADDELTHDPA